MTRIVSENFRLLYLSMFAAARSPNGVFTRSLLGMLIFSAREQLKIPFFQAKLFAFGWKGIGLSFEDFKNKEIFSLSLLGSYLKRMQICISKNDFSFLDAEMQGYKSAGAFFESISGNFRIRALFTLCLSLKLLKLAKRTGISQT